MHEEDLKEMKTFDELLEKEIRKEIKRINAAGAINPTDVKTVTDAICLMLKSKEFEEWLEDEGMSEYSRRNMARSYGENSYAPMRSSITGRFTSRGMDSMDRYSGNYMSPSYGMNMPNAYGMRSYENGYSGHSVNDRMISRIEDMMGEAKNDYEAQQMRDVIAYLRSGK